MNPMNPGNLNHPMRAFIHRRYGPPAEVLRLEEIEQPAIDDGEVLVRVHAAACNPADWHLVRGEPYVARLQLGLRGPKDPVPGCDLAGRVEAVGSRVTTVRPGDEVYGSPFGSGLGAFAEYASVPENQLARKPRNLSRKVVDHKHPRPHERALDLVLCHGSERVVELDVALFLPFGMEEETAEADLALF
ncbi:alcohol dehydrogenase catalytic domain-containing protein [Streptomyces sp. NPDC054802]